MFKVKCGFGSCKWESDFSDDVDKLFVLGAGHFDKMFDDEKEFHKYYGVDVSGNIVAPVDMK